MTTENPPIKEAFDTFINIKDWSKYSGEWVAICGDKVISNNSDLKKVIEESSKKCGNKKPLFTKIPEKNIAMIL